MKPEELRALQKDISSDEEIRAIVVDGDAQKIVQVAMKVAQKVLMNGDNKQKKDWLSTSQIRAIFGEVRQIQAKLSSGTGLSNKADDEKEKLLRRAYLLIPKLNYRAEKEKKQGIRILASVLIPALELVFKTDHIEERCKRFGYFVDFMEAILAYHKAYGGE